MRVKVLKSCIINNKLTKENTELDLENGLAKKLEESGYVKSADTKKLDKVKKAEDLDEVKTEVVAEQKKKKSK